MAFSLFALILVLAITFFQGIHGLFSAVIMCVVSILATILAFGIHEQLYFSYLASRLPDHGRAIALMGIFIISLLVLRTVFDLLITEKIKFPVYVDRAVAGLFGFVTALLVVGMLSVGFQMLPFGEKLLGFARFTPQTDGSQTRNSLWLNPDGLTVKLVSYLSKNALAGENRFSDTFPDFLRSLHRGRAGLAPDAPHTAPVGSLTIDDQHDCACWDLDPRELYVRTQEDKGGQKLIRLDPAGEPPVGAKWCAVRAVLGEGAAKQKFILDHVRLLAADGSGSKPGEFTPIGLNDDQVTPNVLARFGVRHSFQREPIEGKTTIDFVFEVPDTGFQPIFLEFKQNARAEILPSHICQEGRIPPLGIKSTSRTKTKKKSRRDRSSPPVRERRSSRKQDRVSGLGPVAAGTRFSDELPLPLTQYRATDLELSGGKIRGGRLQARLEDDWRPIDGRENPIERFEVPEGRELLQLSVEKLQPGSWLGRIYGQTIDSVGDFYLIDDRKQQHRVVGAYAMARVSRKPVFELIYLDETAREAGAKLPKFDKIKGDNLRRDYVLVYLFHLPPGTRPAELHTGRKSVDLTGLDLVAPG